MVGDEDARMSERNTSRSTVSQIARWIVPFVVSGVFFAYVLSGVDTAAVVDRMTARVALYFLPPLAIFLVVSLFIEAVCLVVVVSHSRPFSSLWIAARIKAASYLLGLLNYALGAGAVTLLLRRRASMSLADAAGAVFLIGLFDLGSLLLMVLVGAGLLGSEALGVQAGVVMLATGAIVAGFAVLRAPISLGPFDGLRRLTVFRAARTLPISLLLQLGALRLAFISSFILLSWSVFAAFEISLPPVNLIVNISILLLVSALPIAVAGLGTGQLVFVSLFDRWASAETLLAASLTLSFGLIVTRSIIGLLFAREFTSEALAASREANP